MRIILPCSFSFVIVVVLNAAVRAEEIPDRKLAHYLITGWQSEREKLVSGKFCAAITEQKSKRQSAMRICSSFDHTMGLAKSSVAQGKQVKGVWIRTPEFFAQCPINSSPVVSLIKPGDPKLSFVLDFDPRCFGMFVIGDYNRPSTFEEVVQRLKKYKLVKVVPATKDAYELEWSRSGPRMDVKMLMVIDPSKGFSCERHQVFTRRKQPKDEPEWKTASLSVAKWVRLKDVWVPDSLSLEGLLDHRLQVSLEWEKVNESFPDVEFQIAGMGVPPGTIIADARLSPDTPIIIGRVGENVSIPPPPPPISTLKYLRPWTLLVLCVVGCAGAVLYYCLRRHKKT